MATQGFVTISDHRYFPGVVALVNSLRQHHDLPITVIDEGLTEDQRDALAQADVEVRRVSRSIPINSDRFGCCYALFDIDAAPYDRIVCIDPDAIVLAPLHDVFGAVTQHGLVASAANGAGALLQKGYRQKMAKSLPRGKWKRLSFLLRFPRYLRFVLGDKGRPMSSGLVGVRRELMPGLRTAAMRYQDYFKALRWPDQDLLSYCVLDLGLDWKAFPYAYNAARLHEPAAQPALSETQSIPRALNDCVTTQFSEFGLRIINSHRDHLASGGLDIRVLHFAGAFKPWKEMELRSGFRELWQRYYDDGRLAPPRSRQSIPCENLAPPPAFA